MRPCDKITPSRKKLCETRDFYCASLNCHEILVTADVRVAPRWYIYINANPEKNTNL